MCAAMLTLQAVVLGLTTPVLISVAGVDVSTALWAGLGLSAVCLVTAGLLRQPWAYLVGWAIQAVTVGLGFVIPAMFLLGIIFAGLWAGAYFLGGRMDIEKAERKVLEKQWSVEHPPPS